MAGFGGVILGFLLSLERLIASDASQGKVGDVGELSRVLALGGNFQGLDDDGIGGSWEDCLATRGSIERFHH